MEHINNHKKLYILATLFFVGLTIVVAILPALDNQYTIKPLPQAERLSESAIRGKAIFISNGCVACHSQQVRSIDMDRAWGKRPSVAADYAGNKRTDFWRNTATLMGTSRTGPDLTDVGNRQPSLDWNLIHLYNPRIVVKESIMPGYSFLFLHKQNTDKSDVVVSVPEQWKRGNKGKVVASQQALDLVAYLQSLKQTKLPDGITGPNFLYAKDPSKPNEEQQMNNTESKKATAVNGENLYRTNCMSCHQESGEGLSGSFPPLKGSKIVMGKDLKLYVDIIMNGYDARAEYGSMPAIGANLSWTEYEIAALINFERTSWRNKAEKVTPEEIRKIMDEINNSKK